MLRKHEESLNDKKRFTALVKDLFPDQAKNVNLLLMDKVYERVALV